MKIVFLGSPACALPSLEKLLKYGHQIPLIICQPDRPSGRGKKLTSCPVKRFALDRNIQVYQPQSIRKDPNALSVISSLNPDVCVVVAYGQIIPSKLLEVPPHGFFNVHFSLLPHYRGAAPVARAILKGEEITGVTIIRLNEKMDEGDILTRMGVAVLPYETAGELEMRLAEKGAELLVNTLSHLDEITPQKQDHSQATYAPKIDKEEGLIDWNQEATAIERKVRAFTPWPSAYTYFQGKRLKILSGRALPEKTSSDKQAGLILKADKAGIQICCGGGSIFLITSLQPQNKKPMSAYSFSLGQKIKPESTFFG